MIPGDDFELDVHEQRRRVLWQRTYLQALDRLMQPRYAATGGPLLLEDPECSRRAGTLADDAVRRFDGWEQQQGKARRPAGEMAGGGGGDPDGNEDDSDSLYLGR